MPFKSICEIYLRIVTLEDASGASRGEIHAISCSTVTHAPNWTNMVLGSVSGLISNTQLRTKGTSSLEPITIPSLGHTLGGDLVEDKHLCPVRYLKVYLARRKPIRELQRLLFISFQNKKSFDNSQNTISGWVRALLQCLL